MPVVSPVAREIAFKIVYYGPGLGGKTTTLQYIHATAKPEHRGKMVSLATPVERTLYFDFLPIRLPSVRGMSVRLQLFTVPGQVYYNATRKLVLTGVDGVVLVFDSQRARMEANLESLENLAENLRVHGRSLTDVPHVIEYNKRDLNDVFSVEELDRQLNREHAPSFATSATSGEGIYEALEAIARAVLDDFERRVPENRGGSAAQLELAEGGLVEALRRADADPERFGVALGPGSAARSSDRVSGSQLSEAAAGDGAARAGAGDPELSPASTDGPPGRLSAPDRSLSVSEPARESAMPDAAAALLGGFSFEALWSSAAERVLVKELEHALGAGDYVRSVAAAGRLVARTLASVGALLAGAQDAPREPATVLLLLGLDGQRYLELRALVRDVRGGRAPSRFEALRAYATAIEARLLRAKIDG